MGILQTCTITFIFIYFRVDPLFYLEQDLNTVQLMLTDDNVINSQVEQMLEQLGVKRLTPQHVAQHHIVPTLQDQHRWKVSAKCKCKCRGTVSARYILMFNNTRLNCIQ